MKIEIEEKDWITLDDFVYEIKDVEYLLPSGDLSFSKLQEIIEEKFPSKWSEETEELVPLKGYFCCIGYLPFVRGQVACRTKSYDILKLILMYSRMIDSNIMEWKNTE